MRVLIGSTGFVGGVLAKSIDFDMCFNSKNMDSYGDVPDGCDVYLCCLPAQKWIVNGDPIRDLRNMTSILDVVSKKRYGRVVLVSTIDVYSESPLGSDESFTPSFSRPGYGLNRHLFELMVSGCIKRDVLGIFRLPALFGHGLRKNVLYDLLNNNCADKINYNSSFQWYDMSDLRGDIDSRMGNGGTFNMFTEPVETAEICSLLGLQVVSGGQRLAYDYRTTQSSTGYLMGKAEVLERIGRYCDEFKRQQSCVATARP